MIWSLLRERLASRLLVYTGPFVVGGTRAIALAHGRPGAEKIVEGVRLEPVGTELYGSGTLTEYRIVKKPDGHTRTDSR